ncbi:MAG: hypothetical protein PUE85_08095 [Firmicutes bacterium]|nr:hypothetical protein [Bacillota bacterium]
MAEYKEIGIKGKYLIYKNKPLVRDKNMLCYGSMDDEYVLFMMILDNKKLECGSLEDKPEVPNRILVQIMSTDEKKPAHERLAKQFEKNGLYEAMDIGLIWLNKMNKNK